MPPDIANPIVQKGLHELRRLMNGIISEYGKPDIVRIEMSRDLEMNTKRYKAAEKRRKNNTKTNEEAEEKYREMLATNPHLRLSTYMSRNDKLKYRLWLDQDRCCCYSGRPISMSTLFSPDIDVDHILPYSLTLDDSYMNKVVCFTEENRFKGQQTPIDAYGQSDKWEQIAQRIKRWPKQLGNKRDRFYTSAGELTKISEFINSQLNDSRYISRVAQAYIRQLGVEVTTTKGMITSWLRHMWHLNSLLGDDLKKNRADHRHHAVDATVIATVDRGFYQTIVREAKRLERLRDEFSINQLHFDPPWMNLRADLLEKLKRVVVSHSPQRKITGPLHEDTGAGFIAGRGSVYRKNLDKNFKSTQVKAIIDDEIRRIITNHLAQYGNDSKKAFAEGVDVVHRNGRPIRRVRVIQSSTYKNSEKLERVKYGVRDKQGRIFKWMTLGNIHHIEVLSETDDNYFGQFVTTFEASRRAKGIRGPKEPIIKTDNEGYNFVMALHINDTVSLRMDQQRSLYRVKGLGQLDQNRQPRPVLMPLNVAKGNEGNITDSIKNLMKQYQMKPVKVNVIGREIHD